MISFQGLSQAFDIQSSTPNIFYPGPAKRVNQQRDLGSVNQSTLHDHQASDQSTLHENSTQDQSTMDQSDLDHSVLDQSEKLSVPEQITSKSEATKSSSTSETAVSVDTTIMIQEDHTVDTNIMMQEDHTYHQITHQSSSPSMICFPPNYSYGCLEKKWSL